MEISFNSRHYAHVPVLYWPWIWWQLFWLRNWAEAVRRDVLYEIGENGRVYVRLISDDKADLRSWLNAQAQVYRDHWTVMQDASGEAHLSAIHYWMSRFMQRGEREIWLAAWIIDRAPPALQDSS
ncbi:MAG: hypothetical protein Hens3KO_27050 [Henriciella sp.]